MTPRKRGHNPLILGNEGRNFLGCPERKEVFAHSVESNSTTWWFQVILSTFAVFEGFISH